MSKITKRNTNHIGELNKEVISRVRTDSIVIDEEEMQQKKEQEKMFIDLGKKLYDKEIKEKCYQDNFDFLKERFNKNCEITIPKKDFCCKTIERIYLDIQQDFDLDGDELASLVYPRILEHKIVDLEKELEIQKETYQDLDDIANDYSKEIDNYEKRIEKAKEVVKKKNDIIAEYEKNLKKSSNLIGELLTLFILSLIALWLSVVYPESTNYIINLIGKFLINILNMIWTIFIEILNVVNIVIIKIFF